MVDRGYEWILLLSQDWKKWIAKNEKQVKPNMFWMIFI